MIQQQICNLAFMDVIQNTLIIKANFKSIHPPVYIIRILYFKSCIFLNQPDGWLLDTETLFVSVVTCLTPTCIYLYLSVYSAVLSVFEQTQIYFMHPYTLTFFDWELLFFSPREKILICK